MNKSSETLWSRFSQFAAWCAQQFLDAVAAISGFYYSHKYAAIARRLGYSQTVQRAPKRGFIIIQIDGLSHQHLLEAMAEDGTLDSESKKQASRLKREMRKIRANLQGVRAMSRLPGAVIVVDAKKEYLALREAAKLEIATVGLLDTDSDPDTVDVAIPANDDSIRAVDLILNELADAVAIGKTMTTARQEAAPQRARRVRSRRPAMARAREESPKAVATVAQHPASGAPPEAPAAPTAPAAPATEAISPESQTEQPSAQ